jgi:hypothetical protein
MKKYSSALLLAALLGLSQCRQHDPAPQPPASPLDQLPPATQTGQGTFGCLVNGQAWTPAGSPLGGPLFTTQYYNQQLTISASRSTTVNGIRVDQGIEINVNKVQLPGIIMLSDSTKNFVNVVDLMTKCTYYTGKDHPGTLEITRLDLAARIVSGRFAFALETPGCGKVTVTDGRFDSRF